MSLQWSTRLHDNVKLDFEGKQSTNSPKNPIGKFEFVL